MKNPNLKRALCFLSLLGALSVARADLTIEQKLESSMQNGNLTMRIKGDKMRTDLPTGPMGTMSTIMDLNTGDSVTLIAAQKMLMKASGAQTREAIEMAQKQAGVKATAGASAAKLQATGKMERVGEHNAEIYTFSDKGISQTLWVAKDFPNYAKFNEQLNKVSKLAGGVLAPGGTLDLSTLPGMVVKTQMEMAGQKFVSTLVSAKEETLDAALFVAPADYKEFSMPSFPGAGKP